MKPFLVEEGISNEMLSGIEQHGYYIHRDIINITDAAALRALMEIRYDQDQFKKAGIRADIDTSDDRMQKKVRNAQLEKIPFMLIAGDEDMSAKAVSFRYRNGEQKNQIPIQQAIDEVLTAVKDRKQI